MSMVCQISPDVPRMVIGMKRLCSWRRVAGVRGMVWRWAEALYLWLEGVSIEKLSRFERYGVVLYEILLIATRNYSILLADKYMRTIRTC